MKKFIGLMGGWEGGRHKEPKSYNYYDVIYVNYRQGRFIVKM